MDGSVPSAERRDALTPYLLPAARCGSGARCPGWLPDVAPNSPSFACPPPSLGRSPGRARSRRTCRACGKAVCPPREGPALCLCGLRHGHWLLEAGPTLSPQTPARKCSRERSHPSMYTRLTHSPCMHTHACIRTAHACTCSHTYTHTCTQIHGPQCAHQTAVKSPGWRAGGGRWRPQDAGGSISLSLS